MKTLISYITEAETRNPGDTWTTKGGKFRGKNQTGHMQSFTDPEKTKAYVATKGAGGGEEEPTKGANGAEDEPKVVEPKKKEQPKQKSSGSSTGYKGPKNKSLDDVDTSNSPTFTEDIDPSDEKYTPPKKYANPNPPPPFKMPEIKSRKFPKKYLKAIERMANSRKGGTKPITQDFIQGVGAGQAGSQAGEMLALMCVGMDKEDWDGLKKGLLEHENALKTHPNTRELHNKKDKKTGKLSDDGGKNRLVDKSWIEAAENNRIAIDRQVKMMHGSDAEIVATGWDVEADVEAMGWKGRYKESKGHSTDMYAKVKKGDGSVVMHEPSLKKDDKIKFSNGTTANMVDWNPKEKGGPLDPQTLGTNETNRLTSALDGKRAEVEKLAKKDPLKAQIEARGLTVDQVLDPSSGGGNARDKKKGAFIAMNALAGAPEYGYQEGGPNKGKVLLADPPTKEQLAVKEHIDDVREYCDKTTRAIVEDPIMKQGMLDSVGKEFPIKSVADGEETMAIGDSSLDVATMKKIFGTSDFDTIKENLKVDENAPDGPPHLAFQAGPEGDMIRIAEIKIRQDGIGYGAPTIKFEMNMDKEFADKLRQANKDVYGELPQTEEVVNEIVRFKYFDKSIYRNR